MQVHDLWIGEKVWVKSQQVEGVFEGLTGGQAKIKIGADHFLIDPGDITPAKPPEEILDLSWLKEQTPGLAKKKTPEQSLSVIDLHIEVLKPELTTATPARILEYQLAACRKFLLQAIAEKRYRITIIHGIGAGVLKLEVEHLLQEFNEIRYIIPTNQEGALEVWLS